MSIFGIGINNGDEYYTPKAIVDLFGKFDYDPATTHEKANEFGIEHYDTIETDGLTSDWTKYRRIWINPPFSRKHEFIAKAWETYQQTRADIYIVFPISFMTTKKFHSVVGGGLIHVPNYRINFENKYSKGSPSTGSVIMKVQDKWELKLTPTQSQ